MMKTKVSSSFAALVASLWIGIGASAGLAQSTDTAESEDGGSIESQLSLGEDANAPQGLGEVYPKEAHGDWEYRCLRTENPENDPCQMYQLLKDEQGSPVSEFNLFRLPEGGKAIAGATVIVPLETQLTNQLTINIDGGKAKRYPFAFCNVEGCFARVGLTEADIQAFQKGNNAVISIVPALAPDKVVKLTLSLKGFTASYKTTSVISP